MENLPASVFLEIFLFLNKPNLRGCRQVSQSWNEIISTSPNLNSSIVYVVDKTFNSVEPLLHTKTGWPALRFSGCFKMGRLMSYIPTTILNTLSTLHANDCVINRECLTQIFAITSLIDLHLNHCHLQNSIFQETTPEPLEIYSINIRSLTILMCDRDIAYLAQHLLPNLKSLVSFTIQEMSSHSILQKLQPYQIKDDFYGFPDTELNQLPEITRNGDNSDNANDYDSEPEPNLENEFQAFFQQLHQFNAQMGQFIFPLPMIQHDIDIGIQIFQPEEVQEDQQHELEGLVQEDFIGNAGEPNFVEVEIAEALLDSQDEAMEDHIEDEIGNGDFDGQIENAQNIDLEEQIQDGNGQLYAFEGQIEANEVETIHIDENGGGIVVQNETIAVNEGPTEEINSEESTEVNSQYTQLAVILDSTILRIIELIKTNAKTLDKINLSFRRSMHAWNNQLFTHVVQSFLENQVQLKSLTLNAFNIPMRNVFTTLFNGPGGPSHNPLPDSFGENVAFNLKQFLRSQTRLTKLTLGLRQLLPTIQLDILKEVPQSVEILTIWPVEHKTHDNLLGRFPNLKELRIPQDSTVINFPPGGLMEMFGQNHVIGIHSLARNLVKESDELPKLTSFKGHLFYTTDDAVRDFCRVAFNLTELRLRCLYFGDSDLQIVIQNLRSLKRLELISTQVTEAGLTGFEPNEIDQIKKSDNYPHILADSNFVASGLPLSSLTHLEEIKFGERISDFGIHYGLNGLQLRVLDLDTRYMSLDITDWGLNVLAGQAIDMEIVHLRLGWSVTEEGMQNFVSSLKSLDRRNSKITHVNRASVFNFRKAKDIIRAHVELFEEEEEE